MEAPQAKLRLPALLSSAHSRQLKAYALAASAAGVGLLALTKPAEGEVVYTPVHVTLSGVGRSTYTIDVNHDGITDYGFTLSNSQFVGMLSVDAWANQLTTSNGVEFKGSIFLPVALNPGSPIGSHDRFFGCIGCSTYQDLVFVARGRKAGYWANVSDRYLGLKFFVGSNTYYGWARLSVKVDGKTVTALLTGYAYEDMPNLPIRAGQTSGTFDDPVFGEESSATTRGPLAEKFTESGAATIAWDDGGPIQSAIVPRSLGALALGAAGMEFFGRRTKQ
ncbi:MAG TPA: hypothetical protein VMF10_13745 [Candidatus Aquilonibacter sp.]|nr:hypothetical protein [Candidatus Aquilonibacter sp.]